MCSILENFHYLKFLIFPPIPLFLPFNLLFKKIILKKNIRNQR